MPRKPATPKAAPTRTRRAKAAAPPPQPAGSIWPIVLTSLLALATVAYRFRDKIPVPAPASADTQLARDAVHRHSQLLISEIIQPLRAANNGTLTNEQTLATVKTAHPVIDRHTWSPLADRLTQLQAVDKDGKPTGLMDQQALARFLDDCEAGIR